MGVNESTIKTLTEPINTLELNCGHSDCKSKCGSCFELEIDTAHYPTVQPRENTHESMDTSITNIVEVHCENKTNIPPPTL